MVVPDTEQNRYTRVDSECECACVHVTTTGYTHRLRERERDKTSMYKSTVQYSNKDHSTMVQDCLR